MSLSFDYEPPPPAHDGHHVDAGLGTAPSPERFVTSSRWAGAKPGYVFTTRHGATGYDVDHATEPEEPAPKRARAVSHGYRAYVKELAACTGAPSAKKFAGNKREQ